MYKILLNVALIFFGFSQVNAGFTDTLKGVLNSDAVSNSIKTLEKSVNPALLDTAKNAVFGNNEARNEVVNEFKIIFEAASKSMFVDLEKVNLAKINDKEAQILCESIKEIVKSANPGKNLLTISCKSTQITDGLLSKFRQIVAENKEVTKIQIILVQE